MDVFTEGYMVCALWSSCDEEGSPLDSWATVDDIAEETRKQMQEDCERFQKANADDLAGIDPAYAGHDYWLTRNGHGAGFWDRGLGVVGKRLTDAAHADGSVDLYVGDDGKVHGE